MKGLVVILFMYSFILNAQEEQQILLPQEVDSFGKTDGLFKFRNSVQLELLGVAAVYSVNYERILINRRKWKTAGGVGFSFLPYDVHRSFSFPIQLTEMYSISEHHIEMGLGVNPNYTTNEADDETWKMFLVGRVGYRYQKESGRFLFRASAIPMYLNGKINSVWGALCFGYTF